MPRELSGLCAYADLACLIWMSQLCIFSSCLCQLLVRQLVSPNRQRGDAHQRSIGLAPDVALQHLLN